MLYQKDRIEVVIRKEESGQSLVGAKEKQADEIDAENAGKSEAQKEKSEKRTLFLNTMHLANVAISSAKASARTYINNLSNAYGDEAYQAQANRKIEFLGDTLGNMIYVAGATITGIRFGGTIGAILGATGSMVNVVSNLANKFIGRELEYNTKVAKENNSIEYKRAISHINLTNGRLR